MASRDSTAGAAHGEVERWRRRSRVVRLLRVAMPVAIVLIIAGLVGAVVYNTLRPGTEVPQASNRPIRLVNPRFVGRDDRGRAFVITATSATRDPKQYEKVYLDHPSLVLDEQGPDPTRITARDGVYHQDTGKLEVSGGVRMASARAAFETATSQFDTKTGELVGSGPVQGSGPLGEIDAKSYGVYEKGDRMVFDGGVHTRLIPK